jgi:hypothetical protein
VLCDKLKDQTLAELDSLIEKYNAKPEIERLVKEGEGELFSIKSLNHEDRISLESTVLLPSLLFGKNIDDFIYVVENWISLTSTIRNQIGSNCEWKAYIDDLILVWDARKKKYVLPSLLL